MNDIDKIRKKLFSEDRRKKLFSEDRPDDIWFNETIAALCLEIEELRDQAERAWEYMAGEDA